MKRQPVTPTASVAAITPTVSPAARFSAYESVWPAVTTGEVSSTSVTGVMAGTCRVMAQLDGTSLSTAISFDVRVPLTWTVVHPIDSESPLWGKTPEDLERVQAELLILLKAYDDTFSQTVLARHSYRNDEILWGKRFAPAFFIDEAGDMVVEVKKVGAVVG